MWFILLVIVLAIVLYFSLIKPHKYWAEKGVPFKKPTPLVGNIWKNIVQKTAFAYLLDDFYFGHPKDRYVGFYNLLTPTLMLRDPELIKKITVKEFDTFPEHRAFASEDVDPLWGKNLFAMKGGEKWHDMRATLSPSFTSSKMRVMYELMRDCAQQFTKYFEKKGGTVTVEMKDAFTRFTNDVIATTAFGVTCDSLEYPQNDFYLMGKDATNFSGIRGLKFFVSSISPQLMKLLQIGIFSKEVSTFFRGLIKEAVRVREENGIVRPDMIHLLMEARKGRMQPDDEKVSDSGFAVVQESGLRLNQKRRKPELSDDDITAQALIFFIAGFDTVSTLMCFTSYELALNPDIQETLYQEIKEAFDNNGEKLSYEVLLGLKYLDMVVSESLRKWPPSIALDRFSVKPFTIEKELPQEKTITLEAGSNVWIPVYPLHRDPKYYPNPEKFDPERFNEVNKQNIKPFTYLPFGAGPRNCIGSRFALLEAKLVIAETIRKFEIVTVAKTPIPLILSPKTFVPCPVEGFWLGLKSRISN